MPRARKPPTAMGVSANRTDLAAPVPTPPPPPSQPLTVAPGQPYGEAGAQRDAMRALPLPDIRGQQQAAIGQPPPAPGPAATPAAYDGSQLQAEARAMPFRPVPLGAPTARPNEPVTAGSPLGAGPGPEALNPAAAPTPQTTADLLSRLAYRSPEIQDLLNRASSGHL